MEKDFTAAIAACLQASSPTELKDLPGLVAEVLRLRLANDPTARPKRTDLEQLQAKILTATSGRDELALIYGGATRIKGYVFESPRLPEIRGASALLDWVNKQALPQLWREVVGKQLGKDTLADDCIVYASGGNILAFAPAKLGDTLAAKIECLYAEHTLTANSVAVAQTFHLLEIGFGRDPLGYWFDRFAQDWDKPELQPVLNSYYWGEKHEPLDARFFRRKSFGELVTILASLANRRRDSRDSDGSRRDIPHFPLVPGAVRCTSSALRPAVVEPPIPDSPQLSEASALKLYVGQRMKRDTSRDWFNWFEREEYFNYCPDIVADDQWQSWEERFKENPAYAIYQKKSQSGVRPEPASDVGEIAQASSPAGYIGLIYADGNNVGRRVATMRTPEEYAALSDALDNASTNAVFQALARHLAPAWVTTDRGQRWVHPFEIITIGGDDLLLIVPGSAALEIALTIGYEFERAKGICGSLNTRVLNSRYRRPPTTPLPADAPDFGSYTPDIGLSAGVIIAPENTPIFFLRDLAEELLKSAKKRAKDGGAVDFMILKAISMVTDTVAAFREQALGTGTTSTMRLTGRPYSWPELQGLLATACELKRVGFPRSQLYRLRQHLLDAQDEGGVAGSVLDYLYTQVKGLRAAHRDALRTEFDLAWHDVTQRDCPPWRSKAREVRQRGTDDKARIPGYETVWPDLVEILEFV